MPELVEQMYCSQQIVIPPKFPYILKRYCKAAIKTQPYDLLRWSCEYFTALSQHRPPPVKLRLEYPVYSTEGGLTRGCLKVLAQQLSDMTDVPLSAARAAWQGFCLDQNELRRIFCLCGVYLRQDSVPFLHLIAVAAGLLTKNLTHTMILLCESLTKEPDGGSAAIPINDFLIMYRFLAKLDASKDIKYYNGYPEGSGPEPEQSVEEEQPPSAVEEQEDTESDDFWGESEKQKLSIIDGHVGRGSKLSERMNAPAIGNIERSPSVERASQIERENYLRERKDGHVGRGSKLSERMNAPAIGNIERSPSVERASQIERENYLRERKGRPTRDEEIDKKLRKMSSSMLPSSEATDKAEAKPESKTEEKTEGVEINVFNEDDEEVPYEFYGEPKEPYSDEEEETPEVKPSDVEEEAKDEQEPEVDEKERVALLIAELYQARKDRQEDLLQTFEDIAAIVDKYKSANYDLGMVAGRQMSSTSGEFVVQHIENEIMASVDEQIAVLPDPDLKKKKAKPEEVLMIKDILNTFLDENLDAIVAELVQVEEEDAPIPEITIVYAVPGIGPIVDIDIMKEFEDYAQDVCKVQADVFMPRNIRHFLCPPLEKYIEHIYEELEKKNEELATGGAITE